MVKAENLFTSSDSGSESASGSIEGLKGHIIFKEREYDSAPKTIALLKTGNHYHGITNIPGFLNRSYFCRHCEKCYNTEDAAHHNCKGQNCPACHRQNKKCPNFATWLTPEVYCCQCNRHFTVKIVMKLI